MLEEHLRECLQPLYDGYCGEACGQCVSTRSHNQQPFLLDPILYQVKLPSNMRRCAIARPLRRSWPTGAADNLTQPNTRVYHTIEQIDNQVNEHVHHSHNKDETPQGFEIVGGQGFPGIFPDTWPSHDSLDQDVAGH